MRAPTSALSPLTSPMKILVVAGARPNFMKVAPIFRAIAAAGHEHVFVHTGQHWDDSMSAAFLRDLDIPEPDHHLRVGSATHAVQTANTMTAFEPVLLETRPDWVVVVGDVNSTLACGLVVAKLRAELPTRLAHVEAGLRSRDWTMPEEVNRVLVDRISDLLLLPSEDARANLLAEGIEPARIAFAGNVMIDTLLHVLPRARALPLPFDLGDAPYVVSTLHRPSNVDDRDSSRSSCAGSRRSPSGDRSCCRYIRARASASAASASRAR